jgi:hypothetical protein
MAMWNPWSRDIFFHVSKRVLREELGASTFGVHRNFSHCKNVHTKQDDIKYQRQPGYPNTDAATHDLCNHS